MISWDFFSIANNLGDSVAFNLQSDKYVPTLRVEHALVEAAFDIAKEVQPVGSLRIVVVGHVAPTEHGEDIFTSILAEPS